MYYLFGPERYPGTRGVGIQHHLTLDVYKPACIEVHLPSFRTLEIHVEVSIQVHPGLVPVSCLAGVVPGHILAEESLQRSHFISGAILGQNEGDKIPACVDQARRRGGALVGMAPSWRNYLYGGGLKS